MAPVRYLAAHPEIAPRPAAPLLARPARRGTTLAWRCQRGQAPIGRCAAVHTRAAINQQAAIGEAAAVGGGVQVHMRQRLRYRRHAPPASPRLMRPQAPVDVRDHVVRVAAADPALVPPATVLAIAVALALAGFIQAT